MFRSKKNIWKSLLITLAINNLVMVVVWTIMSAFGYKPHYLMSFVIWNVIAVLFWLLRVFGGQW